MHSEQEDDMSFTIRMKDLIIFSWMFLLFIFSWISVAVVGRAIDNICFQNLGLSEKSTLHTVVIAIVVVLIELLTLFYFSYLGMDLYGDLSNMRKCSEEHTETQKTTEDTKSLSNRDDFDFFDKISALSSLGKIEGITLI